MVETTTSGVQRAIRSVTHRLSGETPELPVEGHLPGFDGATGWLNSEPLTPEGLRGRVVLVDFWTYTCINWLRTLPYRRAWHEKYADLGVTVIGAHTPEFGFERNVDNIIPRAREFRRRLSDRDRQRLRRLAGVRQPLLAGPVHRRRRGPHPLSPLRRGRVRHVRDGRPAAAPRGGCRGLRSGARRGGSEGLRGRSRLVDPRIARDVPRLRPEQRLRVARPRAVQRAAQLSGSRRGSTSTSGRRPGRGRSRSTRPCSTSPVDGSLSASGPATSTW